MGTYNIFAYDSSNIVPIVPASSDTANVPGDLTIAGNLTVNGTTTTVNAEIATADRFIHLNSDYNAEAVEDGGLVLTVDPEHGTKIQGSASTVTVASTTTITINSDVTANFAANDIIQINSAETAANDGLYQIHSAVHDGGSPGTTTITIKDASTNTPNASVASFVKTAVDNSGGVDATIVISVVKVGVLKTDSANGKFQVAFGSSNLTYANLLMSTDSITASSIAADDIAAGDAAVNLTTTTGNITIDAQANDSDIIFKGTDGSADTTFLTIDGSEAGTAIFNNDLQLKSDASVLSFGADLDVSLTHVADTGLLLNGASVIQFRDSDISIGSAADGVLDLTADTRIDLNSDVTITGTTPTLTIGDNGAEDVALVFDNGTQDYYIAIDHSDSQKLLFGLGGTVETNAALTLDSNANLTAAGRILVDDATDATSTTDGSLQTDGGLSVAKDAVIGNDLKLLSDSAVLNFGADSDVSLTHVADTALLLNSSRQLQFGDSATHIKQVSDSNLEIEADGSVIIDSPVLDLDDDGVIVKFGADDDVTLTHVADTGLTLGGAGSATSLKIDNTATDGDSKIEFA